MDSMPGSYSTSTIICMGIMYPERMTDMTLMGFTEELQRHPPADRVSRRRPAGRLTAGLADQAVD